MSGLNPSLGALACKWIQTFLIHGEGDYYGQPFRLTPLQKAFLWRWYEYEGELKADVPPRWVHNEALLGLPKGEGKTEFLAAIADLEFAGPPQIARRSAVIPIAAASFEQADLLFGAAKTMLTDDQAPLAAHFDGFDTEILRADGLPGSIKRVAAAAGTNDGKRSTLVIADELHEWTGNKARVFTVLANGVKKRRNGRVIACTTAGVAAPDGDPLSLCETFYLQAIEAFLDPATHPRLLALWYEAADHWDLTDPAQLEAAILQCSPSVDVLYSLEDRLAAYRDPKLPKHDFRRYFLNQWREAEQADSWLDDLPEGHWERLADPTISPAPGDDCWLGVDMALRHDSIALAAVWPQPDGRHLVRWYIQTRHTNDDRLDHVETFDVIRFLAATYNIRGVGYDPRFFELPAQQLEDDGIPTIEFPQTPERMAPACAHIFEVIATARIVHNDQADATAHMNAARRRISERGWTLSKRTSGRPIDATIAVTIGVWLADHPPAPPEDPAAGWVAGVA